MAYPTARRDTDSVVRAIKHFCARRKIKQVCSDDGPELINACVELKLNHDLSLPGRPQSNSLAERTNQFIIDQTSACLVHAGLPTCYWVQAITTLCHLMNGSSAWLRLHGEEFKGEKIPFGALVDFKPSEAREKREKFEPRGETGIFAGYVLSTGMHWANSIGLGPSLRFCRCRTEHQEGKGSTSIENATSNGEDDSQITSDIPNTTDVQSCQ